MLRKLGGALCLGEAEQTVLRALFTTNLHAWNTRPATPRTYTPPEIGFALWGFARTPCARDAVLDLLRRVLRPRVLFAGNTRESFFEVFLLVRADFVPCAPTADELETWLEGFVEALHMSGGVSKLDTYMDAGTVALIDRIEQLSAGKCVGTLSSPRNRDFYRFFTQTRAVLAADRACHVHLGLELSLQSMQLLQRQGAANRAAVDRAQNLIAVHVRQLERAEMELRSFRVGVLEAARVLVQLERTGAINEDALSALLAHLGLQQARVPATDLRLVRVDRVNSGARV